MLEYKLGAATVTKYSSVDIKNFLETEFSNDTLEVIVLFLIRFRSVLGNTQFHHAGHPICSSY